MPSRHSARAKSKTAGNALASALQGLDAAGKDGFEGFVAALLSAHTGVPFRVARSGPQSGRDIDSARSEPWHVAVECKRYWPTTSLSERDLRVEIDIALSTDPDLDLWVLASSRDIDASLDRALQTHASHSGIDFLVLACGSAEAPGALDALCASQATTTLNFIAQHSASNSEPVGTYLDAVRAHSGFAAICTQLRQALAAASVGLPSFRTRLNKRLIEALCDPHQSRSRFGSPLHVGAPSTSFPAVERSQLSTALSDFWQASRVSKDAALCVVHGEEGDGKSWAVAAWAHQLAAQPDAPAIFWISPAEMDERPALDQLAAHAQRHIDPARDVNYPKKLARWLASPGPRAAIVVLDGINERHDQPAWTRLMAGLLGGFSGSLAVIVTCRTQTWDSSYKDRMGPIARPQRTLVGPFNDTEFDQATSQLEAPTKQRLSELGGLTRKPRYLALAIRHVHEFGHARELTVPRLYYEDWKSRLFQKSDLALDPDKFEALLRLLAQRAREGARKLSEKQIADELPAAINNANILEELATSGVLLEGRDGLYLVEEPYFVVGMSLLLLDRTESETGDAEARAECIAQWLGDISSWPLSAKICEDAAWRACLAEQPDHTAAVALLLAWSQCQNIEPAGLDSIGRLVSINTGAFCEFCELLWAQDRVDHAIESAILAGMVRVADDDQSGPALAVWFKRWLGFVHEHGETTQPMDSPAAQRRNQNITARLPAVGATAGSSYLWVQRIAHQRQLRLGRLAIAVISSAHRLAYWEALVTGLLADALMGGHKSDVLRWTVMSSRQDVSDHALDAVRQLDGLEMDAAAICADQIIRYVGDISHHELRERCAQRVALLSTPAPALHWPHSRPNIAELPAYLTDRRNPSHLRMAWAMEQATNQAFSFPQTFIDDLVQVAQASDARLRRRGLHQTEHDLNWDRFALLLCRVAPELYAEKCRELVRDAPTRDDTALRLLAFAIEDFQALLGPAELAAVRAGWERMLDQPQPRSSDTLGCEAWLFRALLPSLPAASQVELLLRRGQAHHYDAMTAMFKQLPTTGDQHWLVAQADSDDQALTPVLWFATKQADLNESLWLPLIDRALASTTTLTRALALLLLSRFAAPAIAAAMQQHAMRYGPDQCPLENHLITRLLLQYGDGTPEQVLSRCDLAFCGELLGEMSRPELPGLLQAYASILLGALEHLLKPDVATPVRPSVSMNIKRPAPQGGMAGWAVDTSEVDNSFTMRSELSTWGGLGPSPAGALFQPPQHDPIDGMQAALQRDFDRAEADGNWLFGAFWSDASIDQLLHHAPEFLAQFDAVVAAPAAIKRRHVVAPLIEAVARRLIAADDPCGWRWLSQIEGIHSGQCAINGRTGMSVIDEAVYAAAPSEAAQTEWLRRLNDAKSDRDLTRICSALMAGGNTQWLRRHAASELASNAPFYRWRGLTLVGLAAADESELEKAVEQQRIPAPDTDATVRHARRTVRSASQMKYWLEQGVLANDAIARICAGRLFLACADFRAWQFLTAAREKCSGHRLADYYAFKATLPDSSIKKSIKDQEAELAKHLFGHRVCAHDAVPWLDA